MSIQPYFNIIKSILPQYNTISRVLWNYIFFGLQPFYLRNDLHPISPLYSYNVLAQRRVSIHCAAKVFIMRYSKQLILMFFLYRYLVYFIVEPQLSKPILIALCSIPCTWPSTFGKSITEAENSNVLFKNHSIYFKKSIANILQFCHVWSWCSEVTVISEIFSFKNSLSNVIKEKVIVIFQQDSETNVTFTHKYSHFLVTLVHCYIFLSILQFFFNTIIRLL